MTFQLKHIDTKLIQFTFKNEINDIDSNKTAKFLFQEARLGICNQIFLF